MRFLNRRQQPQQPPQRAPEAPPNVPAPTQPAGERDLGRPLLSLVYALRTWGQYAPTISQTEGADVEGDEPKPIPPFEQWARRVYKFSEGDRVDFDALERFVLQGRADEQRSIEKSLRDLRESLWAFVECFSKSTSEDSTADGKSVEAVERLRAAVVGGDIAIIKREALLAAQNVRSAITSRQRRQRDDIDKLSAKLEDISNALIRAKRDGETDPLTGLFNRAALTAHTLRMTQMCVLMPTPPLLAVIDIDHFKWVNDKYGHAVGDQVIRKVAAHLSATCRRGEDFVARYGGDELVAILEGVAVGSDAAQADRILFAIREIEVPAGSDVLRVSCSLGLARAKPGDTPETWFQRADDALYQSKRAGRDRATSADVSPAT